MDEGRTESVAAEEKNMQGKSRKNLRIILRNVIGNVQYSQEASGDGTAGKESVKVSVRCLQKAGIHL